MVENRRFFSDFSPKVIPQVNSIFLVLLVIATLVATLESPRIIFLAVVVLALPCIVFRSLRNFFYFFLFYIVTFEEPGLSVYFPGIPIKYITLVAGSVFFLLILYWALGRLSDNQASYSFLNTDKAILAFLVLTLFSGIYGFLRAYKLGNILEDLLPLCYFGTYFIVSTTDLKNEPDRFFNFLLFCTFLISLQFIYALSIFKSSIVLNRIVSQHIHMAQFAVPYIGSVLLYSENMRQKKWCFFILPFVFAGVFISQQRALWFSVFVTVLVFIILGLKKYRVTIKKHIGNVAMAIFGFFLICVLAVVLIRKVSQGNVFFTVLARSSVFLSPKFLMYDESAQIRINELKETLEENKEEILFGKGLGDVRMTRWRDTYQLTVDNSFIFLLWKMGIIGLFSFMLIYFLLFKRMLRLLKMPLKSNEKIVIMTILWNFVGMLIVAISNASLAHYRFIFVWATMIAIVETVYRKYA